MGKITFKAIEKYRYGLPKTVSKHLKDESLGLPCSGLGVIKADVIVSSVVFETDFDAITADIIVESGVLVSIGVI